MRLRSRRIAWATFAASLMDWGPRKFFAFVAVGIAIVLVVTLIVKLLAGSL